MKALCMVGNSPASKADREIEHGRRLAQGDSERTWGWGTPAGRVRAQRRAQMIAAGAGLGPGVRALEIGCGTGLFTELFSRSGASIVAVDISPDLLERARARGLPGDRVEFVQMRFEECHSMGLFDAVIGSSILHHLDVRIALTKIRAMLKPKGIVCFTEPNMLNPQVMLQKNVPWLKRRLGDSPDETAFIRWHIRDILRECGFSDVQVRPFDWLHPFIPSRYIPLIQKIGHRAERIPMLRELAGSIFIRGRRR